MIKYLIEGLVVAFAAYYLPQRNMDLKEIILIGLSAGMVFILLDLASSKVSDGVRQGAGFNLIGGNNDLDNPMSDDDPNGDDGPNGDDSGPSGTEDPSSKEESEDESGDDNDTDDNEDKDTDDKDDKDDSNDNDDDDDSNDNDDDDEDNETPNSEDANQRRINQQEDIYENFVGGPATLH